MNLGGRKLEKKTNKDRFRELDSAIQNVQMATQISQMMLKQVLEQFQGLRRDVDNSMGILNDFQYRTQAMLELGNYDVEKLNEIAGRLKLEDYMKASDAEDAAKGFELDDDGVVGEESVVIITSTTNGDSDRGIFRSKFPMSECGTETLKEKLLGSKVGETVEEEINGDLHSITVVGLRKVAVPVVAEGEGANDGEKDEGN